MTTIAILDYGVGNVLSIYNAVVKIGSKVVITNDKTEILAADGLIIPGVGAFAHGMRSLVQYDLVNFVQDVASSSKPIMGICLGMQMLFSHSSEFGTTQGLNLIDGRVEKLKHPEGEKIKLPHVSWNNISKNEKIEWGSTILESVSNSEEMYFVHSFAAIPSNSENILSTTNYQGVEFCSSVKRSNIYGCQFHPEKSALEGLKVISNFSKICQE